MSISHYNTNGTPGQVRKENEAEGAQASNEEFHHPNASISKTDAGEVKWLLENTDLSLKAIADYYGISYGSIQYIADRDGYQSVDPREPEYDWKNTFEEEYDRPYRRGRKISRDDIGEIKWLLRNEEIKQKNIVTYYDTSNGVVYKIKNNISWEDIPPKKPDYDVDRVFALIRENEKTYEKRHLTDKQAAEVKWLSFYTEISQGNIGEYYGVGREVVSYIKNERSYKNIEPREPDFDIQKEFSRYFGKNYDIHSGKGKLGTKEISEIKWMARNTRIYPELISKKYNASLQTIRRIERGCRHKHVKATEPDYNLEEVFSEFYNSKPDIPRNLPLNHEQISNIKYMVEETYLYQTQIAEMFNITRNTISNLKKRAFYYRIEKKPPENIDQLLK